MYIVIWSHFAPPDSCYVKNKNSHWILYFDFIYFFTLDILVSDFKYQ